MPLSKEEREQLAALQAKEKEPPARSDSVGVSFLYDPDDPESVKRGISRGHLTVEEAESWGHDRKKLGIKSDDDGDDDDDDDDSTRRPTARARRRKAAKPKADPIKPNRRGGYFKE